jgi:hypothetical protein
MSEVCPAQSITKPPGRVLERGALATAADGLDYPASIAFGLGDDASSLYIANVGAAFGTPSVMRATIGAT